MRILIFHGSSATLCSLFVRFPAQTLRLIWIRTILMLCTSYICTQLYQKVDRYSPQTMYSCWSIRKTHWNEALQLAPILRSLDELQECNPFNAVVDTYNWPVFRLWTPLPILMLPIDHIVLAAAGSFADAMVYWRHYQLSHIPFAWSGWEASLSR